MPTGRQPNTGYPSGRRAIVAALALLGAVTGCATGGGPDPRAAERQGAIERWNACVERQDAAAALNGATYRPGDGCEGYRRDVLRAFPPSMESRLQRMMDERTARQVRTRLDERTAGDPLLRRLLSELDER